MRRGAATGEAAGGQAEGRQVSAAVPTAAPLQSLIGSRILALREQRVMFDSDLADLYGVQTEVPVQAVKRNLARFPADFSFSFRSRSSRL